MHPPSTLVEPTARLLLCLLFVVSGVRKVIFTAPTQAYMEVHGVPGILIYPAAAFELTSAVLLLTGLWIRPLSWLLAGWCVLTAAIFHTKFSDAVQLNNFFKNMTMAGGFLMLTQFGSVSFSLDGILAGRRPPARQ
jgi:putative oxidoreductase